MSRVCVFCFIGLSVISSWASDINELVQPEAEVRKLADGFGFGEGPAWHPGEQALYFSDLKNKTIHRWSKKDGLSTVRQGKETFANGIVVDDQGRLVFCETGACRVLRRESDGSETELVSKVGNQLIGLTNDLWMASDGGLYVTVPNKKGRDSRFKNGKTLMGTIIYVAPDGTVSDVGAGVKVKAPNGIVGSVDGKRLYFRDGGSCRVADIQPDGSLTKARIAAPKGTDGLTLDARGNLYTTSKDGVEVFAPDASRIGLIPVPETPANLTFGGKEGSTLFITARTGLYAVEMMVKGDAFTGGNDSSAKKAPAKLTESALPEKHIGSFFEQHCYECHDDLSSKGDLDLTSVSLKDLDEDAVNLWTMIHKRVEAGEMPPSDKERPTADDLKEFLGKVAGNLTSRELKERENNGRAEVRRMNRSEYENTLKDILALPYLNIVQSLPPEGSAHGFDKSADALDFSHVHASRMMEVADKALRMAIAPSLEKPASRKVRFDVKGSDNLKNNCNGMYALLKQSNAMPMVGMEVDTTVTRIRGDFEKRDPGKATDQPPFFDALALFINGEFNLGMSIKPFKITVPGYYTIRVNGFGVHNDKGKLIPSERVETVGFYSKNRTLGFVDLPSYKPSTGEIKVWLEPGDQIKPLVASAPFARIQIPVKAKPGTKLTGPEAFRKFTAHGVAFRWFELEGPLNEVWPPESHKRLFGDLEVSMESRKAQGNNKPVSNYVADISSEDPAKDGRRLMRTFLNRALRRPVTADDMKVPMAMVNQKLRREEPFMEAMLSGYRAVLSSPSFLLMNSKPGALDEYALAERLSYFLWSSSPDATLRNLAREGKLREPEQLRKQVERMLGDERSQRFVAHFLDKWLKLEDIALTEPDANLYPDYTPLLMDSSLWETRAFFTEMLKQDLGADHVIDSDFAMVNQRLAELYGLSGVKGNTIQRVSLPADSVRGGFLTQASVLKTTANGTVTSPVVRGDYVMTHILGDPPPPPPAAVAAVEPDISGATTIRDQLAKHREVKSCAACHSKIDPPGFALENFDVMGGYRQRYRSLEKGDPLELVLNGRKANTKAGLPVDASGETPEGKPFQDIEEYRSILLTQKDKVARHMLEQLIVYATGAPVDFADRELVDEMLEESAKSNYGLRSMIHRIVSSPLFLEK